MKYLVGTLFVLITANSTFSQAGWIEQTFDTTLYLISVQFVDESTGWLVGQDISASGVVYKTSNKGFDWYKQLGDTIPTLTSLFFTDFNTGHIVGAGGRILKTTDGGETWSDNSLEENYYSDVQFTDENIGYIVGMENKKTTDGGNSWFHLSYSMGVNLSFVSNDTGYVLALDRSSIYKTNNGGISWDTVFAPFLYSCAEVFFIDETTGWVGGVAFDSSTGNLGAVISKTTNGGRDWSEQFNNSAIDSHTGISSLYFIDNDNGWATSQGYLLHTTNGGDNWDEQIYDTSRVNFYEGLLDINFVNENIGWAVGKKGIILHTTTGGVSFIGNEQIDLFPTEYSISQNYPNPFNPSTTIRYEIPERSIVTIKIYDILGNEIATLVNEEKPVGNYEVEFDGSGLTSGIYFYSLSAGKYFTTKKMVLLK